MVSASSLGFLKAVSAPVKAFVRSSPRLNAALWDVQYKIGLWDFLDTGDEEGRELAGIVERHAPQARVLDLGCGTSANLPLAPGAYRGYHGVDISAKAIKQARALGRPRSTYEVADILTYLPREPYDAILLREVIYYLPVAKVSAFLGRLSGSLAPGGVVVIQLWAGERKPELIAAIEGAALPVLAETTLEVDPGHPTVYLLGKSGSDASPPARAVTAPNPAN